MSLTAELFAAAAESTAVSAYIGAGSASADTAVSLAVLEIFVALVLFDGVGVC